MRPAEGLHFNTLVDVYSVSLRTVLYCAVVLQREMATMGEEGAWHWHWQSENSAEQHVIEESSDRFVVDADVNSNCSGGCAFCCTYARLQ